MSTQERQEAQNRLLILGLVAALLILVLLQMSFSSWRLSFLVFLTLPMALVGGVLAAFGFGRHPLLGIPGWVSHGLRHCRAQWNPAHQPLPAPRAARG
ncbi:MAG: efflux RND transporter permease subunit [Nocardioidaceae bacterium]